MYLICLATHSVLYAIWAIMTVHEIRGLRFETQSDNMACRCRFCFKISVSLEQTVHTITTVADSTVYALLYNRKRKPIPLLTPVRLYSTYINNYRKNTHKKNNEKIVCEGTIGTLITLCTACRHDLAVTDWNFQGHSRCAKPCTFIPQLSHRHTTMLHLCK